MFIEMILLYLLHLVYNTFVFLVVMKIKTDKLCQFATPLDGDTHMKPEVSLHMYILFK